MPNEAMNIDMEMQAQMENLPAWLEAVSSEAHRLGFEEKRIREIELALEEALVNVVSYAYDEPGGMVRISTFIDEAHSFWCIQIIDEGKPFDIASAGEPDLDAPLSERQIGGLGVYLIRKLMDDVRYERMGSRNVLTLSVKLPGGTQAMGKGR
uniref:ATP-binding protein n=1 Tax=Desulfatirhabdium butyrativorans TaxID=340467 RepID=A0A7C4VS76_9BACT